jgi:uncharacterized protein with von Willebrand factor type A (vWA) domain
LLMLSKFANGEMLQRVAVKKKRNPVIVLVDSSGSMFPSEYATALGYALALGEHFIRDNRGWCLGQFHSKLYSMSSNDEKVIDKCPELGIKTVLGWEGLLHMLTNPSVGGTDFHKTLSSGLDLNNLVEWKDTKIILISDGEDNISKENAAYLKTRKTEGATITAVMIAQSKKKNPDRSYGGIFDEIITANGSELTEKLADLTDSLV